MKIPKTSQPFYKRLLRLRLGMFFYQLLKHVIHSKDFQLKVHHTK